MSAERRQFGRRRAFTHALIALHGRPLLACTVQNISEGGALVALPEAPTLPIRFRLLIDSEGLDADCEVRHRDATSLGVQFVAKRKFSRTA